MYVRNYDLTLGSFLFVVHSKLIYTQRINKMGRLVSTVTMESVVRFNGFFLASDRFKNETLFRL